MYGKSSPGEWLSVVPSEQLRLQPISSGNSPAEQTIAEESVGNIVDVPPSCTTNLRDLVNDESWR